MHQLQGYFWERLNYFEVINAHAPATGLMSISIYQYRPVYTSMDMYLCMQVVSYLELVRCRYLYKFLKSNYRSKVSICHNHIVCQTRLKWLRWLTQLASSSHFHYPVALAIQ